MSSSQHFAPKQQRNSAPTAKVGNPLRSPQRSTPVSASAPLAQQEPSNQPARLRFSLDRIPIFPPAPIPPSEDASAATIRRSAQDGLRTPSTTLPFIQQIQRSFGRHNVSQLRAHMGPEATASALAMNARAYTTGDHIVFAGTPSLSTAAHEAAHAIQQRQGVRLANGIGTVGRSL